jgi:hypothetical protein
MTDAASNVSHSRLQAAIRKRRSTWEEEAGAATQPVDKALECFSHYTVPTLSHLLAMTIHAQPSFPISGTTLLVIDDLNMIIDIDYPRVFYTASQQSESQKWQASRRYAVLGSLVSALNKLAVLHGLAVVVTTGCSSRMRSDSGLGSALVPGISGAEWDGGTYNKLVIFRDFSSRFIGVQKCQGRSLVSREEIGETGRLLAFDINQNGGLSQPPALLNTRQGNPVRMFIKKSPIKARKRTFDEVADSEGEDADEFGWDGDEEALAGEAGGAETDEPPLPSALPTAT